MNGSWLLQRRSFPSCAGACGSALRGWRAAHGGQDDMAVRWAGDVENLKELHSQSTYILRPPLSAFRFPLSALRLCSPLSAFRSPLSAFRFPLSDLRSPLSAYVLRFPLSAFRFPLMFSALRFPLMFSAPRSCSLLSRYGDRWVTKHCWDYGK